MNSGQTCTNPIDFRLAHFETTPNCQTANLLPQHYQLWEQSPPSAIVGIWIVELGIHEKRVCFDACRLQKNWKCLQLFLAGRTTKKFTWGFKLLFSGWILSKQWELHKMLFYMREDIQKNTHAKNCNNKKASCRKADSESNRQLKLVSRPDLTAELLLPLDWPMNHNQSLWWWCCSLKITHANQQICPFFEGFSQA